MNLNHFLTIRIKKRSEYIFLFKIGFNRHDQFAIHIIAIDNFIARNIFLLEIV